MLSIYLVVRLFSEKGKPGVIRGRKATAPERVPRRAALPERGYPQVGYFFRCFFQVCRKRGGGRHEKTPLYSDHVCDGLWSFCGECFR